MEGVGQSKSRLCIVVAVALSAIILIGIAVSMHSEDRDTIHARREALEREGRFRWHDVDELALAHLQYHDDSPTSQYLARLGCAGGRCKQMTDHLTESFAGIPRRCATSIARRHQGAVEHIPKEASHTLGFLAQRTASRASLARELHARLGITPETILNILDMYERISREGMVVHNGEVVSGKKAEEQALNDVVHGSEIVQDASKEVLSASTPAGISAVLQRAFTSLPPSRCDALAAEFVKLTEGKQMTVTSLPLRGLIARCAFENSIYSDPSMGSITVGDMQMIGLIAASALSNMVDLYEAVENDHPGTYDTTGPRFGVSAADRHTEKDRTFLMSRPGMTRFGSYGHDISTNFRLVGGYGPKRQKYPKLRMRDVGPFDMSDKQMKEIANDVAKSTGSTQVVRPDLIAQLKRKLDSMHAFGHTYSSLAGAPLNQKQSNLIKLLKAVDVQMDDADHEWTAKESEAARKDVEALLRKFGHAHTSLAATPLHEDERELVQMLKMIDMQMNKPNRSQTDEMRQSIINDLKDEMTLSSFGHAYTSLAQTPIGTTSKIRGDHMNTLVGDTSWSEKETDRYRQSQMEKMRQELAQSFGHAHTSLAATPLDIDDSAIRSILQRVRTDFKKANSEWRADETDARRDSLIAQLRSKMEQVQSFGHTYSSLAATPLNRSESELVKMLQLVDVQMGDADHDWSPEETELARKALLSKLSFGNGHGYGHSYSSLGSTEVNAEQRDLVRLLRLVELQMNKPNSEWSKSETDAVRDTILSKMREGVNLRKFGHAYTSLAQTPIGTTSKIRGDHMNTLVGDTSWSEKETDRYRQSQMEKMRQELAQSFGHAHTSLAATPLDIDDSAIRSILQRVRTDFKKANSEWRADETDARRDSLIAQLRSKMEQVQSFGHTYSSLAATPLNRSESELVKMLQLVDVQMGDADHDWSPEETELARKALLSKLSFGNGHGYGHSYSSLGSTEVNAEQRDLVRLLRLVELQMNKPNTKSETDAVRDTILSKMRENVNLRKFGHAYTSLAQTPIGKVAAIETLLRSVRHDMGARNASSDYGERQRQIDMLNSDKVAFGYASSLAKDMAGEEKRIYQRLRERFGRTLSDKAITDISKNHIRASTALRQCRRTNGINNRCLNHVLASRTLVRAHVASEIANKLKKALTAEQAASLLPHFDKLYRHI